MPSHPLLEAAAQDDRTHDEELRFARNFAAHPLWVAGRYGEPVNGRARTRLSFMPYDGGTRLGLTAYVEEGAHLGDPGFDDTAVIACSGAVLLSWTQQQKFDAVLSDGEHIAILPYTALCNLRTALLLTSGTPQVQVSRGLPRVDLFARSLYDYCERHPDVQACWLCFIVAPGIVTSVGVWLEAGLRAAHEEEFDRLALLHLPPGVGLLHLAGEGRRSPLGTPEVRQQAAFYQRGQPLGWWGRLRRSLVRPRVPVVTVAPAGLQAAEPGAGS
ncbi:hypothetical protein [Eleftheria terrae]|uniref:hypothetical protein n=1 Tax=Eleftheria terrae TaxID=1597781 RepID=UPI00263A9453|nr:hypothetical protein [Eleftheria terrae]WKB51039.1 hypothetical protein N7L95_14595 [Eleftheria terrae]